METPHILIDIPEYFPKEFDDLIFSDFQVEGLNIDIRRSGPQMFACLDWAIPGLIATYLFKPYFEAFLSEAGKDHYQLLKNKMSQLLLSARQLNVRRISASQSSEKINDSDSQSKAISVFIQTRDNRLIKLLYDDDLDFETWVSATNQMLELMKLHYSNGNDDPISNYLKQLPNQNPNTLFAYIDPETKNWYMISNLGAFDVERRKKKEKN